MGNPIISIIVVAFIAIFFYWLFTGDKPFGRKEIKVKTKKPSYFFWTIFNLTLILVGYYIRKEIEYPNLFENQIPQGFPKPLMYEIIYLIGILVILVGFSNIIEVIQKIGYSKFVQVKIDQFKDGQFWKDYQEYKNHLYDNGFNRLRLNYKGLLKYHKKEIFSFWMAESYERGFLEGRIKNSMYFVIACLIFYPIALFMYSELMSGAESFYEANNGVYKIRYYWLFVVWGSARLLVILTILVVGHLAYKVWDNYNRSVVNYDDPNYYFVRAKKYEAEKNLVQAIRNWEEFKNYVGNRNITVGGIHGIDYPLENFDKKKIESIISKLKNQL